MRYARYVRLLSKICQSVWSPLSVEETVLDHLLPFLRLSAQLHQHLFQEELLQPMSSAPVQVGLVVRLCSALLSLGFIISRTLPFGVCVCVLFIDYIQ